MLKAWWGLIFKEEIVFYSVPPYAHSYMGTNIKGGDRDKGCDFLLRNLIGGGVEEGEIDDALRWWILASWDLSGAVQTASFVIARVSSTMHSPNIKMNVKGSTRLLLEVD